MHRCNKGEAKNGGCEEINASPARTLSVSSSIEVSAWYVTTASVN